MWQTQDQTIPGLCSCLSLLRTPESDFTIMPKQKHGLHERSSGSSVPFGNLFMCHIFCLAHFKCPSSGWKIKKICTLLFLAFFTTKPQTYHVGASVKLIHLRPYFGSQQCKETGSCEASIQLVRAAVKASRC